MSRTISRDKYESIKEKASQWRDKALDYESRYESIFKENEKLIEQNEQLQDKLVDMPVVDDEEVNELKREIKVLMKKNKALEDKRGSDFFDLERQLLRKEGEVDRLTAAVEDYKERYKEFREEINLMRRERASKI